MSHPELNGAGRVVSAGATAAPEPARLPSGKVEAPVAHALDGAGVRRAVQQFVDGARRALEAGIDLVEIHGANGYLIQQFLSPATNLRDDEWGGSPAKRARFAIEVTQAVAEAVGAGRVGIRLSPENPVHMGETDAEQTLETYLTWAEAVADLGLAFVDVLHPDPAGRIVQDIRRTARAPMILNTGFASPTTRDEATSIMKEGLADAVAVGRSVMANPDLVRRWRDGLPETPLDPNTIYATGPSGYTDYPTFD